MPQISSEALSNAVMRLYHETISRFPPSYAPGRSPQGDPPYRLGDYLVELGYLTPREVDTTLSQRQSSGKNVPFGMACVARNLVPAPVVAAVLLLQTLDRIENATEDSHRFMGEQLLMDGHLTADQLAMVLQEQVSEHLQGRPTRVGDLIMQHGWVDSATLTREAVQATSSKV